MKNLVTILLAWCITASAAAQKVYFAYFELENGGAFFVKTSDKVYSATAPGYIIIPELRDTVHNFSIGFPSSSAEVRFQVTMSGRDRGFTIRQFDFGWGLFDLQSLSIIKPLADDRQSGVSYQYRTNDFTALLARASSDTSLFYVPVEIKEDVARNKKKPKEEVIPAVLPDTSMDLAVVEIKREADVLKIDTALRNEEGTIRMEDIVQAEERPMKYSLQNFSIDTASVQIVMTDSMDYRVHPPDSSALIIKDTALETDTVAVEDVAIIQQETAPVAEYKRSEVKRYSESSTVEGFGLVFHDKTEEGIDTIKLIIPNPRIVFHQPDTSRIAEGMLELQKGETAPVEPAATKAKSNCKTVAVYNDFLKLRRNMAAKETDEAMINEAKKAFRSRCYTTEQLKNLSALFLTAAGKYAFFDAAYKHIADPEAFKLLEAEISDAYYQNRFKALIGE